MLMAAGGHLAGLGSPTGPAPAFSSLSQPWMPSAQLLASRCQPVPGPVPLGQIRPRDSCGNSVRTRGALPDLGSPPLASLLMPLLHTACAPRRGSEGRGGAGRPPLHPQLQKGKLRVRNAKWLARLQLVAQVGQHHPAHRLENQGCGVTDWGWGGREGSWRWWPEPTAGPRLSPGRGAGQEDWGCPHRAALCQARPGARRSWDSAQPGGGGPLWGQQGRAGLSRARRVCFPEVPPARTLGLPAAGTQLCVWAAALAWP